MSAEQALLGALLSGYPDVAEVARIVAGRDFRQLPHEWIFDAVLRVHATGPVDPVKVAIELGDQVNQLPEGQGQLYLHTLTAACPNPISAPWYAGQVAKESAWRRLGEIGHEFVQRSQDAQDDPFEVAGNAAQRLDEFVTHGDDGLIDMADVIPQVVEIQQHGIQRGLSSPWPDLDDMTRGFKPGRLYVVGARPGVGKSLFATNTAVHTANQGYRVFFSSMEMPAYELGIRCMAARAKIPYASIEEGQALDALEQDRFDREALWMSRQPIAIADSESQTLVSIRGNSRKVARRGNLGLIVVDYVQLVLASSSKLSRQEAVSESARGLKRLAREHGVPVIALAQVNRGPEQRSDKRPSMGDLRESGELEAAADCVILLHTPADAQHLVEVHVVKGRSNAKGDCTLQIQGHLSRLVSSMRAVA